MRRIALCTIVIALAWLAAWPLAQGTAPASPLTMVTRDGRRAVPTTIISGQEMIALDDVATLFQATVREDTLAGGVTVTYKGRSIVASPDQPMASVNGRVVTLSSPVLHVGRRWLVPVEFLSRALAPIFDQRIELRRPARLLIVGDVRVPRVVARLESTGNPTRVTMEVTPATPVTASTDNGRVVLRIDADALDLTVPSAGGGAIEQVRAGDQPNTVTIVLAASATARTATAPFDGGTRVTVDVSTGPGGAPPPTDTSVPPRPALPLPDAVAPPVVAARQPGVQTIVLDAGHGGNDTGARAAGGLLEKDITLDIARRVRALIEARLGIRVVMTRDDDRAVSLDERSAVANNAKADLFLSLHGNASPARSVSGAEVYHLKADRDVQAVRRQADTDALLLPVLGGGTRRVDLIRWDMAQARHVEVSSALATMVREDLAGHGVPMSARPQQQAPLRVLEATDMPAVLVEVAFLTNAEQEEQLAGDAFKTTVAQSLFDSIARFRTSRETP